MIFHIAKIFIIFLLLANNILTFSQTVENVRFTQEGEKIIIYYDLKDKAGAKYLYAISVFYSLDNGSTYIPLKSVLGDIGKNISPGNNKKLTWNVLADVNELSGEVKFKVNASPEKKVRTFGDYDFFINTRTQGHFWPFGGRMGILGPGSIGFYVSFYYGIYYEDFEEKYLLLGGPNVNIVNREKFRVALFSGAGYSYYDEYYEYFDYHDGFQYGWTKRYGFIYEGGLFFNFNHFNIITGIEATDIIVLFAGIGFTL
jgi:hypothetical protein